MAYRKQARAELVAVLLSVGGRIADPSGLVASRLVDSYRPLFGERDAQSVSALVTAMVGAGILGRDMPTSRRTHAIWLDEVPQMLVDKAAQLLVRSVGPEQTRVWLQEAERDGVLSPVVVTGASRAAQLGPSGSELAASVRQLRTELRGVRQELEQTRRQRDELQQELVELREVVRIASADAATFEEDLAVLYGRLDAAGIDVDKLPVLAGS